MTVKASLPFMARRCWGVRPRWAALVLALVLGLGLVGGGAMQAQAADSAVILLYHRFGDKRYPTTNVTEKQFEAHIAELTSGAYHVMRLNDIIDAFKSGRDLPDRTVAITVDDAYESVYKVAYPRLKAAGLPFTLFVSTGPVDGGDSDFMTWDQIREMAANGADVGNHTVSHLHMIGQGDETNGDEISKAQARLTQELGKAPMLFAFPYGEFGMAEAALVERMGFKAAFGQYSGVADASAQLYSLPRFAMNENYAGLDRFRLIVNALPVKARDFVPGDPVLGDNPPAFGFTLIENVKGIRSLACYPSNTDAPAKITVLGEERIEVRFDKPFPQGRSRINCTMRDADGRWRWLGRPFFVK